MEDRIKKIERKVKDSEIKEEKRDGKGEEKIKISWGNKVKEMEWKMELLKKRKERKRNVIISGIEEEERRKRRELQGFSRN